MSASAGSFRVRSWSSLSGFAGSRPNRRLGTRAVTVLQLRHGLTGQPPMTLDEIGKRFGVTRERIRQIEKKALDALRERVETR